MLTYGRERWQDRTRFGPEQISGGAGFVGSLTYSWASDSNFDWLQTAITTAAGFLIGFGVGAFVSVRARGMENLGYHCNVQGGMSLTRGW